MSMCFEEIVENEVNEFNDLEGWDYYRVINKDGCHYDVAVNDMESAIAESGYNKEDVVRVEHIFYTVKCEILLEYIK